MPSGLLESRIDVAKLLMWSNSTKNSEYISANVQCCTTWKLCDALQHDFESGIIYIYTEYAEYKNIYVFHRTNHAVLQGKYNLFDIFKM